MNTEYVYFVFFQRTDIPLDSQRVRRPIEYRSRYKFESLSQYTDLERWMMRKICTDHFIITGITFAREEKY